MRTILLVLSFGLLFSSCLQASNSQGLYSRLPINPVFSRLGVEDGLSQGTVFAITQDSRGYLWFGTESGLNRYDSQSITVFTSLNSKLTDSHITSLEVDPFGYLWVGTEKGGLHLVIAEGDDIRSLPLGESPSPGHSHPTISSIISDSYGSIWVATAHAGLFRCDPSSDSDKITITPIGLIPQSGTDARHTMYLTALHFDPSGTLWIGTRQHGLYRIDPHHNPQNSYTLESIGLNNDAQSIQPPVILDLQFDKHGVLWIATEQGLFSYDPLTHQASRRWNDTVELIIRDLYLDRQGALWMASDGAGIALIQPENQDKPVSFFTHLPNLSFSLSANGTEVIYEDCFGILWIGTFRAGLNRLVLSGNDPRTRHRPAFISLPESITLSNSGPFSNAGINAILEDHNADIWLGTETEGVIQLVFSQGGRSDPAIKQIKLPPKKGIPSPTVVTSLALTQDQSLWIGTYTDGLFKLDQPREQGLRHIPADTNRPNTAPPHPFISALLCSPRGDLWIGTIGGGLSCIRKNQTVFEHAPLDSESPNTLSDRSIMSLFMDRSQQLWIGTAFGLNLLASPDDRLEHCTITPIQTPSTQAAPIQEQSINAIYQDLSGFIWIGTQNNGLYRIDKLSGNTAIATQFTTRDGLSGNLVASISEDVRGHLWISTNNGISGYDPVQNHFVTYQQAQGLPVSEFFRGSVCRLSGGDLLFGSHQGAILFNPLSLTLDPVPPLLAFHSILSFVPGQGEQRSLLSSGDKLLLTQRNFPITISFSAIHTVSPLHVKRMYRLNKIDSEWRDIPETQSVTYTSLPTGVHQFMIKAANHDNLWSPTPLLMTLRVSPPFWKSLPFIALLIFFLAVSLTILHFWRLGKAVKKERQKYEKTLLSSEQKDQVIKTIQDYADQSLCFTDPDMTLSKFAALVELPAHNVSQAINSDLGISFPDFINELRISHAQKLLDASIENGQPLKFADLYLSAGFSSQATFNRVFKKIVSATPSDYYISKKINKAKQLLLDEQTASLPLSEIATKTGFNTESAFTRIFKSSENITPAQYRKQKSNPHRNLKSKQK